ncbi:transcriptional regulator [Flavobacterium rivuli WB 3.3-2 = DSM 21788]|uniref:Transcriptional regulator n=1 Tax=Flavobacterium rivuli WB 3.3-2 = DSM 21788 TaxID=1121895 RepID=A0A0A2MCC8_9FLAO|nr:GntR family transcriptional regulator [Flavobacterium rivuli]KGO85945.1 transcriptional regulator [Flavobacterium rivuli WB 3.3-2 = DSM 21788]
MIKKFHIRINDKSRVPKYKQIVDSIVQDISNGILAIGEKIPSINELSELCYFSRDTVEKAYKLLKERKIIVSSPGKGFYIAQSENIIRTNILLMVNKPSSYKMMVYNSFANLVGLEANVTMSVYHNDETLFLNTLEQGLHTYDYFVIQSHFRNKQMNHTSFTDKVVRMLDSIPRDKLILLDNVNPGIRGKYGAISQDFKNDLYNSLVKGLEKIKQYDKIILVYPRKIINPYPAGILQGFKEFCTDHNLDYEILDEIYDDMELQNQKDVYVTIQERDLVNLVRQVNKENLRLGKDIGIISYNETPLKELLGITVISTDFKAMGEAAADMFINKKKEHVKNPFRYIERNSL